MTFSLFTSHWPLITYLSTHPATSGGSIFRCTAKDRGERRASSSQAPHPSFCLSGQKLSRSAVPGGNPLGGLLLSPPNPLRWALAGPLSQSRPLESGFYTGAWRGDVRRPYEFALVQLTRFRPVRGVWQAHCFHGLDCTAPRRRGFSIAVGSALGVHHVRRKRRHLENNRPNL